MRSAFDNEFLAQVAEWIASRGEVLVVVWYVRSGGAKDYLLIRSVEQFHSLLQTIRPENEIIVLRRPQLPIRGIVNEALIHRALTEIRDEEDWFLICPDEHNPCKLSAWGDSTHQALGKTLEEFWGKYVALGPDFEFTGPDSADIQSAIIPSNPTLESL